MRSILEAYYEPQFSDLSHGFRPKRGCHTALRIIRRWGGINWFIEGDIKGCFDNINHERLLSILRENIHDNRFIRLMEELLKAGYLEDWNYEPTLSGTPQGGILSPLLANIYLDRLDTFVETDLIPRFTKGKSRKGSGAYRTLQSRMLRMKYKGDWNTAKVLRKRLQQMPSTDTQDPNFRRLPYIRYADDFLLGFTGPKAEAHEIKTRLKEFLSKDLKLELSGDKTLIPHANTEAARFLGYDIKRLMEDSKHDKDDRRCVNSQLSLRVPKDVVHERCNFYKEHGRILHRAELRSDSDYNIVCLYQSQYRGYMQYYTLAQNINILRRLQWVMTVSLLKTLAAKHKTRVNEVVRKYKSTVQTSEGPRSCFEVKVERKEKTPLVARFGGIPLKRQTWTEIEDHPPNIFYQSGRVELLQRLLAETCEYCGSTDDTEVHHIRKLADVNKRSGRGKPTWMQVMAARRRKTLVVCRTCHLAIHAGKMDIPKASDG
jgi:group II intron reverse transcriptase/maturase